MSKEYEKIEMGVSEKLHEMMSNLKLEHFPTSVEKAEHMENEESEMEHEMMEDILIQLVKKILSEDFGSK